MDWSCPTAIVVGNENRGISDEALALSDLHCSNPMKGMVDSFSMFQLLQAFSCTMQFVIEHLAGGKGIDNKLQDNHKPYIYCRLLILFWCAIELPFCIA
ncbi:uncharacterized protein LOC126621151 isoform X1 [Malus sylvestris]|uniref:uncharacterized protein LOC126621151 isoform X1 n=1 Tax=Malus sylvestris TaxID=3752 RepID=UPI0021ACA1E4|nr:uncharacterized protein LOC126621151 isoform X1 [Malus sylvestris]